MAEREVKIREARAEEAETVLTAFEWLFAPPGSEPPGWEPGAALERLGETIVGERSAALVAFDGGGDGDVAGICTVYLDLRSVRFGDRCWVEDLAVDPGRRSRGIGAALLATARDWAVERSASHLELDSNETRRDAHRFYERERPDWRSIQFTWLLERS